jgi:hypothetical protein
MKSLENTSICYKKFNALEKTENSLTFSAAMGILILII